MSAPDSAMTLTRRLQAFDTWCQARRRQFNYAAVAVVAAAVVLELLDLASAEKLDAYEAVFDRGDASAFPALMAA